MKPKLLDLFCCAGGAGMGYYRAGFEVTGIDIKPQPRYPFTFIQGDALEYLVAHGHEYDVIHASPPCQFWSVATPIEHRAKYPQLIVPTRELLLRLGKPYIIENVGGARKELINPLMLCGSMFGLPIWRHRYFETNPPIYFTPPCCHNFAPILITGQNGHGGQRNRPPKPKIAVKRLAIDIDWMVESEITESIPPAYTEFIGKHIIQYLSAKEIS